MRGELRAGVLYPCGEWHVTVLRGVRAGRGTHRRCRCDANTVQRGAERSDWRRDSHVTTIYALRLFKLYLEDSRHQTSETEGLKL